MGFLLWLKDCVVNLFHLRSKSVKVPEWSVTKPKRKPFGYFLGIDLYEVSAGQCDDMEKAYRFLEALVIELGMTPMAPPYVIHAPAKFDAEGNRVEVFADKAGISAWQPLIESGIQIHTLEPKRFISIDIYTCGNLDREKVLNFITLFYTCKRIETHYLERGIDYYD
jgi:S-adenosylmethionine/arginine decarboxylase-like enzyme